MKTHIVGLCLILLVGNIHLVEAAATTPEERASAIKAWRGNCNDPDPDLRLAYLESAIAGNDQIIARTCVKEALVSDNAEMATMGLRAALAMQSQLAFEFSLPAAYLADLEKAQDDDKREQVRNKAHYASLRALVPLNSAFSFAPKEVNINAQVSQWWVLGTNDKTDDRYVASLSSGGSGLIGNGQILVGSRRHPISLRLHLNSAGMLEGEGKIGDSDPFPVKARLF